MVVRTSNLREKWIHNKLMQVKNVTLKQIEAGIIVVAQLRCSDTNNVEINRSTVESFIVLLS